MSWEIKFWQQKQKNQQKDRQVKLIESPWKVKQTYKEIENVGSGRGDESILKIGI